MTLAREVFNRYIFNSIVGLSFPTQQPEGRTIHVPAASYRRRTIEYAIVPPEGIILHFNLAGLESVVPAAPVITKTDPEWEVVLDATTNKTVYLSCPNPGSNEVIVFDYGTHVIELRVTAT